MYTRHDLTDAECQSLAALLPLERSGTRARPYKSHRLVLCGIAWILATGSPWRDLPQDVFGSWKTVYNRYRRWVKEGLFEKLLDAMLWQLDEQGKLKRELFCVDATIVRAHVSAAGAKDSNDEKEPSDHALGRLQGGFGTKIHLLVDKAGTVLAAKLSGGQCHESRFFENLFQSACVIDLERSETLPEAAGGDKASSCKRICGFLQEDDIEDVIARKINEPRDENFDKEKYRQRNIVERVVGWLKWFRRVGTRYDKTGTSYLSFVQLAIFRRCKHLN